MLTHSTPQEKPWTNFLSTQRFRPFLQSWTMGEVYKELGQTPVRIVIKKEEKIIAICFGYIVHAKRGKHLAVPYGPILSEYLSDNEKNEALTSIITLLTKSAKEERCLFLRISPFWKEENSIALPKSIASPLHLLAEHVWYLPLTEKNQWSIDQKNSTEKSAMRNAEDILAALRKTTRNLIGRARRDGVTIRKSTQPMHDLESHFIRLHDETRKRHQFTPYSNQFFRAQVQHFSQKNECTLYLADYEGQVISASIHMHAYGETSYHHGASASEFSKIPASTLLQWTAIEDALKRGDSIYNFWGIAPMKDGVVQKNHPFAGVTLFKTGFGGALFNLTHCVDVPLSKAYALTYIFEHVRKWRRGF